jgi:hypothetical protein
MNMPAEPCLFCGNPTSLRNLDGPICGNCLLAFQRGRVIGIHACVEQAKKHGASAEVIEQLTALFVAESVARS